MKKECGKRIKKTSVSSTFTPGYLPVTAGKGRLQHGKTAKPARKRAKTA